jgi:hypothetical protein
MAQLQPTHKVTYVLSIWSHRKREHPPLWCGSLETASGQRFDFATLAELNRLLCEVGGWAEPADLDLGLEGGEV